MKRILSLALLCLAAGALVAGCGSTKKDTSSASPSTAAAPSTSTGASTGTSSSSAAGSVVKVEMKNIMFNPATVTAKVGQTVEWTNNDGVPHTVTAKTDGIDSSPINPGATFKFKVTKAGTINYACTIHPGQKGTLKVTA